MTAKFFAILTNQGAALLANAAALGTKLNLTQMAVGDGNGTLPTPDAAQTKLVNQKRIAPLNMLGVDPNNASQIIAEQIIPENEGGFWIREIGIYDDNGVLIAVANCPETYKPQLQEGSGRTQTIRMVLIVSSTAAVTLKIDPSVVLATRELVNNMAIEAKQYSDANLKAHTQAANPHSQYLQAENAFKEIADKGADAIALATKNLKLREIFSGVLGASRNALMNVAAASSTATFVANEIIVEESAGRQYRLTNFNKTINLAITGAGGMDAGKVPVSGFVGLYAIYNPVSGESALLAVNATSAIIPESYAGANMPAGYTASALVSVWRVASGQFVTGYQRDRHISVVTGAVFSITSAVTEYTQYLMDAIVPPNGKTVDLLLSAQETVPNTSVEMTVASFPSGIGGATCNASAATSGASTTSTSYLAATLDIMYQQAIYYKMTSAQNAGYYVLCRGYSV